MNYPRDNRIGRFYVHDKAFSEPEGLVGLFDGAVVLRADHDYERRATCYIAWHPEFRPLLPGSVIPEYTATFYDGNVVPAWVAR